MRRNVAVVMAVAAVTLMPLAAQEPAVPPAAQPTASGPARPQVPLKVLITLSRFQGDKKVSSIPYMVGVLSNAQKTSLRMGVQVPVVTTVFSVKTESANIPQSSYTYRDVGTNIDCDARDAG